MVDQQRSGPMRRIEQAILHVVTVLKYGYHAGGVQMCPLTGGKGAAAAASGEETAVGSTRASTRH